MLLKMSKDVYINKLHDTFDEYNFKYQRTIKMSPVNVKLVTYIDFDGENNDKYPKIKVVIMVKYHYFKIFLKRLHCKLVG